MFIKTKTVSIFNLFRDIKMDFFLIHGHAIVQWANLALSKLENSMVILYINIKQPRKNTAKMHIVSAVFFFKPHTH